MHNAPLISVVITCYNYARYVGAAIECVLAQDYENTELVVVNDGSTDHSLAVISRYADRARIIDQQNEGSIAAYNRGFAATSGDLVIFLDADDLLESETLSRVAAVWSPECAKVQYDLKIIDAHGRDLGRRFCNFAPGYDASRVRDSFRRFGTYRWPVTVGNAYSRWFIEAIFPLEVSVGPDGMLNTVAPVYGDVVTIPAVLGSYRLHGNNGWSSSGSDVSRLPARIQHRRAEVEFMRMHARKRGIPVPEVEVLDHEMAFLNYRLMALKLGLDYEDSRLDSPAALLLRAFRLGFEDRPPARLAIAHALWFSTLSLAPRRLTKSLIQLRYTRAEWGQAAHRKLSRLFGKDRRAAPA